mgnify:CR=1 FL=1
MKNLIVFFAFNLAFTFSTIAQTVAVVNQDAPTTNFTKSNDNAPTQEMEMKKFRKVEKVIINQLQDKIKYPALAYEFGIEGIVLVQFTFDGEIKNAKITKSLGAGCDKAALKALENFPILYQEFGGENLKPIQITVPFRFEL